MIVLKALIKAQSEAPVLYPPEAEPCVRLVGVALTVSDRAMATSEGCELRHQNFSLAV